MKRISIRAIGLAALLAWINSAVSQERPKQPVPPMVSEAAWDVRHLPAETLPAKNSTVEITISRQTTYLTRPLRKDGYVNYVAALNRRLQAGVTPENNAVVPFLKAMGPGEIGPKYRDEYFKLLEIEPLPEKGDYFVELDAYAKALKEAGRPATAEKKDGQDEYWEQLFASAMKRAWSKKEFPILAGWLAANEKPLALLVAASKCPRRYDPLIRAEDCLAATLVWANSYHRDVALRGLLSLIQRRDDVSPVQQYRAPLRALTARAMLRTGEGKVDEAWEDLLACHRLARLVGQGPALNEATFAVSMDLNACAADQVFLRHARLTPAQIARMRNDLDELPPLPRLVEKINFGERFIYLDSVAVLARRGFSTLYFHADGNFTQGLIYMLMDLGARAAIDWDHVLRMGNAWYDRLAEACSKPTRAGRTAARWTRSARAAPQAGCLGQASEITRHLDARRHALRHFGAVRPDPYVHHNFAGRAGVRRPQ